MFLGSGVWVGFIVPLGIFLRSDASIAFVMVVCCVWVFVKGSIFECVFYVWFLETIWLSCSW